MNKGDDVTATNITNISKKLTLFMSSTMFVKLLNRIIKQLNANISVLLSAMCCCQQSLRLCHLCEIMITFTRV